MVKSNQNDKSLSNVVDTVVSQPPGEIFLWPEGMKITAIDMVIIALPKMLFQGDQIMSSLVDADKEINVAIPTGSDNIFFYVKPGMALTLKKSSELFIVSNDHKPRRIRINKPMVNYG